MTSERIGVVKPVRCRPSVFPIMAFPEFPTDDDVRALVRHQYPADEHDAVFALLEPVAHDGHMGWTPARIRLAALAMSKGKRTLIAQWIEQGNKDCRTEHVVKYFSRYLTGGPISDARIIAANEHEVTFLAREGTKSGGERQQVPITLPIREFVRLWSLHVLPKGFTKTRRYRGWSNTRCDQYLERCSILLESSSESLPAESLEFHPIPTATSEDPMSCCPNCGSEMILQREQNKPSWHDIMYSAARPAWYRPWPDRRILPQAAPKR